ncbi:MAG: hypothetical protein AAF138_04715 [Planctomycetota bacterium]
MTVDVVNAVLAAVGVYMVIGLLFAVLFVARGARRLDPHAGGAPVLFKLMILPGSAALWPVLAWRWLAGRSMSRRGDADGSTS